MKPEVKSIIKSFVPGTLFVVVISLIKYYEVTQQISLSTYGVFPRSIDAVSGIFTFPLIHKDYDHLFSNAVPLFVLMAMLSYFYKDMAGRVFLLLWLIGGTWLWMGGRPSYHIGASGMVYGLASFIFFSGIWRKWRSMLAVSMIVVFLYGGMIWGIFPWFKETSWEGHLFGGMAGLLLSWVYRHKAPQRPKYVWEDEIEDDLKMDQSPLMEDKFEDLKTNEPPMSGDKFENEQTDEEEVDKLRDEINDEVLKTDTPQIIYSYIKKNTNLNADDTDERDKIG
jgi:membrane associated rhomboid family serine protease